MEFLKSKRRLLLLLIDSVIFSFVYMFTAIIMALFNAKEFDNINTFGFVIHFAIMFVCIFSARITSGVYKSMWRYADSKAYLMLVVSDVMGGVLAVVLCHYISFATVSQIGAWRGCAFVAMANVMTLSSRFVYQHKYRSQRSNVADSKAKTPVAIVGAGQIGSLLAEELFFNKNSKYNPICFIDSNKDKIGTSILGLKVYAADEKIPAIIKEHSIEEVLVAISDLDDKKVNQFYEDYGAIGCKVKIYDFPIKADVSDPNTKRSLRDVKIEDLLFRDTLNVVNEETISFYKNRVVLVTGGGGSIGSELCRQIAKCSPKQLIILDIYENNAYDIQQELKRKYGSDLNLSVEIASVRDVARLDAIFAYYRPEIVFHAAAHKHVPLMEHSNCEAIKNNVIGTYNTANAAEKYGAKKFILISTDKAVNPTNVMGASKRLCEMVVQCRTNGSTVFAAVRFGNVLGSNGSVIPLFQRQIENGGPVTITDKRIIRYFMTIPEASGLVMQAGAMARLGELFVLDMGKPIKIMDLATNMITLSGLTPGVDIEIIETGLRPGEKLYEELLIKTEHLGKTKNNLIFIEQDQPLTREEVDEKLRILNEAVKNNECKIASQEITLAMKSVVPTFHSPDEVNSSAAESDEMKLAYANK